MLKTILNAIVNGTGPGCDPDGPTVVRFTPLDDYEYQAYCGAEGWRDDQDRPLFAELGHLGDVIVDRTGLEVHLDLDSCDFNSATYFMHIPLKSQRMAYAYASALFGDKPFDPTHENLVALGFERAED